MVSSMTPLVQYGSEVKTLATQYAPELATASAIKPATLAALSANPHNTTAIGQAISQIETAEHVSASAAIGKLVALSKVPKSALAYLQA
ncbi:hypothetical protein ACFFRE_02860, partial [Aciditerrimonas ferrireducens]